MSRLKMLADRQARSAKALERQAVKAKEAREAREVRKTAAKQAQQIEGSGSQTTSALFSPPGPAHGPVPAIPPPAPSRPWAAVRYGSTGLRFTDRSAGGRVGPQPWTVDLVNRLLERAESGGVELCLVWPAKLASLPLLHAMANIERVCAGDIRGLRTVLFPGNHASSMALRGTLVDRQELVDAYRSFWKTQANGATVPVTCTESSAFLAAMGALNDVQLRHPEVPNPALAELVPVFVYQTPKSGWVTSETSALERTLSKVARLATRKALRTQVNEEWQDPGKAPCALMVLHNSTHKVAWKKALTSPALRGEGLPELLLFDATTAAARSNFNAVRRIPEQVRIAEEAGFSSQGFLIVTDDPATYFSLKGQLTEAKRALSMQVWATEPEDVLLSAEPHARDFKLAQRSNANFSVGIVDRDATQIALAFQRLAVACGPEDSPTHRALLDACLYVLRLSNMPAGYKDLTADSAEQAIPDFASQRNAWSTVRLAIQAELDAGNLNEHRTQLDRAIRTAEQLIEDWGDATPMARRLLAEIDRHARGSNHGLSIVLPNSKYIQLAHRFLSRKLGDVWAEIEPKLKWDTLASIGRALGEDLKRKQLVFVGMNADVLRVLLANPGVPHGTVLLVAYKQADSTLRMLEKMKELEPFKPFRGRIGLLAQELDRRLKEIPKPLGISSLADFSPTFRLDDGASTGQGADNSYYRFDLEGGARAYASGWIYRYEPNEDPFFRRMNVSAVRVDDLIFEMNDELRSKVEDALRRASGREGISSVVDPLRMWMQLYHTDVQRRCQLFFKETKRSVLARKIHERMVALNPAAKDCRVGRVYYWLEPPGNDDSRPHASKDGSFFRTFCAALQMSEDDAARYWALIRKTRQFNQSLGRELVARYAEILFQPESATTYRKLPEHVVRQLRQDALLCVHKVERVVAPSGRSALEIEPGDSDARLEREPPSYPRRVQGGGS
ncbi:hypothetical protein RN01_14855 [Cupriavidus sp. SHE]|jgi:hypothetical protein|uniref:Uncharacterized protein n=2 Tax=Burkholderiaceae TaxID=119060 RepID=A0A2L0XBM0_9BURK|nr:hypothetical protein C3Z06_29755 [Cupriavidus metallidurans]KWR81830.1 hypothetical protein RN01_14855 [Cupriavidus sp. SHE]QBP11414.1 hypothetical protein DDF84_017520 [Cupriavidus metallidurans]